jgi:signal transduction histidine kinase
MLRDAIAMRRIRILHLQDSQVVTQRVADHLTGGGLDCQIVRVATDAEFAAAVAAGDVDLIIADFFLNQFQQGQGPALAMRLCPDVACVVVSRPVGEWRAVELIKSGVADYVPLDELNRLSAAVERALREQNERLALRRADRELRRVLRNSRCILWQGDVVGEPGWDDRSAADWPAGKFSWHSAVNDESAARAFFDPGPFEPGGYFRAWTRSRVAEDDRRMGLTAAAALAAGEGSYTQEFRCRDKTGTVRWFFEDVTVQNVSPGKWKTFGVVTDITQNKEAEEARARLLEMEQKARAAAELVNRRKDQFLAILSHELRTPLTPIIAAIGLLKITPNLPAEALTLVEMIRRNAEHETRLIDDLLDLARISNGTLEIAAETIDAHAPLEMAIKSARKDAAAKALAISSDLSAPSHVVRGDAMRLRQVFWHLIGNAVKFTPPGGTIAVRAYNTADGQWAVDITDNGIGIDAEALQRVFDAFEQGEQKLTRRFGGLGMGLTIAKSLVEVHGGAIAVRSAGANAGTIFTVTLPTIGAPVEAATSPDGPASDRSRNESTEHVVVAGFAVSSDANAAPDAVAPPRESATPASVALSDAGAGSVVASTDARASSAAPSGKSANATDSSGAADKALNDAGDNAAVDTAVKAPAARLLLVEDHEDTTRAVARALRSAGHAVTTAGSLQDAIAAVSADRFDLIISDIGLPDGSGWELMRRAGAGGFVRGIALSGYGTSEDIARSKDAGFVEHLVKPVTLSKLEEAIDRVLTAT